MKRKPKLGLSDKPKPRKVNDRIILILDYEFFISLFVDSTTVFFIFSVASWNPTSVSILPTVLRERGFISVPFSSLSISIPSLSIAEKPNITVVVKDGLIAGVVARNDDGYECFVGPEKGICTYYAEENNGAGYKTRADYLHLVCVPEKK